MASCNASRPVPPAPPGAQATALWSLPTPQPTPHSSVGSTATRPDASVPLRPHQRALPDRATVLTNRFCAAAQIANERAVHDLARAIEEDVGNLAFTCNVGWSWASSQGDAIAGLSLMCLPMRDGSAWAVELLGNKSFHWTLAHYGTDGQRQALGPMQIDGSNSGPLGPWKVLAFDFDADGFEEFWVENMIGCGHEPAQKLYTFRAGHLTPYPVPRDMRVDEIYDEDDDGRPDLYTSSLLEVESVPCMFGYEMCASYGFKRLLHSLPDGRFSEDDSIARAFAEHGCKETPSGQPLVQPGYTPTEVDSDKTADAIACARLRGVPSEYIIKELRAQCPSILQSREARKHPNPKWGSILANLSPAEEARHERACPSTAMHAACIDWMFDLANAQATPILQ